MLHASSAALNSFLTSHVSRAQRYIHTISIEIPLRYDKQDSIDHFNSIIALYGKTLSPTTYRRHNEGMYMSFHKITVTVLVVDGFYFSEALKSFAQKSLQLYNQYKPATGFRTLTFR